MSLNVNEPAIRSYGMKQLYIAGPDRYNLFFQWPATEQTYEQWRTGLSVEPENAPGCRCGI